MEKVKVLMYGVGVVGGLIAKCLLEKEGVEIVGAVDVDKKKVGKDLGEVLGVGKKLGVRISDDLASVVSKGKPDGPIFMMASLRLNFIAEEYVPLFVQAGWKRKK